MSIVNSTHEVGNLQACGRTRIWETHTDNLGVVYTRDYLSAAGADYVAIRTEYASSLDIALAEAEASRVIG